ncbi:hypothetical protein [uncultured Cyclobacterium sp.]|uniref:hypothetical protein n=1 Tax=uncultured Cyclobacterium sp. TaxID=453820 RepID=UPI0030EED400
MILALQENKQPDWDVYDSITNAAIIPLTSASAADKSWLVDFADFTKGKWGGRAKLYS